MFRFEKENDKNTLPFFYFQMRCELSGCFFFSFPESGMFVPTAAGREDKLSNVIGWKILERYNLFKEQGKTRPKIPTPPRLSVQSDSIFLIFK